MNPVDEMVARLQATANKAVGYGEPFFELLCEAAALIRSLAAENIRLVDLVNDWNARATTAEAENAVLRSALEPFAKAAGQRQVMCDDTELVTWSAITVGDLRCARAAIGGEQV